MKCNVMLCIKWRQREFTLFSDMYRYIGNIISTIIFSQFICYLQLRPNTLHFIISSSSSVCSSKSCKWKFKIKVTVRTE